MYETSSVVVTDVSTIGSSTAVLREVCDGNTRNAPSAIVRKEPIRQKSQERVHANVPQNDENENKDVDSNRVPEGYSKNGQYHTVRWESQPPATPPKKVCTNVMCVLFGVASSACCSYSLSPSRL